MKMQKYQVKKYFEWGGLKFEPYQYLTVDPSEIENCLSVTKEKTGETIIVGQEAFLKQIEMGKLK